MIGHDYEIVNSEFSGGYVRSQNVDEESGITLRLEEAMPVAVRVVTKKVRSERAMLLGLECLAGRAIAGAKAPPFF